MLPRGADREGVLERLEGLDRDHIREVSQATGVPEADVHGVASFYSLIARGSATRVCDGLSCRLAGGDELAAGHDID